MTFIYIYAYVYIHIHVYIYIYMTLGNSGSTRKKVCGYQWRSSRTCHMGKELWDEFMQTLRTPMPVVVRINRTKPHWEETAMLKNIHGRNVWNMKKEQCMLSNLENGSS